MAMTKYMCAANVEKLVSQRMKNGKWTASDCRSLYGCTMHGFLHELGQALDGGTETSVKKELVKAIRLCWEPCARSVGKCNELVGYVKSVDWLVE